MQHGRLSGSLSGLDSSSIVPFVCVHIVCPLLPIHVYKEFHQNWTQQAILQPRFFVKLN